VAEPNPGERKMVTKRIPAMLFASGVILSAIGCMAPMYRMPAGYSGSYARHLNRSVRTPAVPTGEMFSNNPAGPAAMPPETGNRPMDRAGNTDSTAIPSTEQPPLPPNG